MELAACHWNKFSYCSASVDFNKKITSKSHSTHSTYRFRHHKKGTELSFSSEKAKKWRTHSTSESPITPSASVDETIDDESECDVVTGKEISLGHDSSHGAFNAHLVEAVKNHNGAGILLLSDVEGYLSRDTRDYAYRLACFGFSVLVPDLFRGQPWDPSRPKTEYETWRSQHTDDRVTSVVSSAAQFLQTHVTENKVGPGNGQLALLGFCFGGGKLIEALAADSAGLFSAGVFFYGTRFDPSIAESIKVPLLLVTGELDPLCSVETVKEVEARVQGLSQSMVFPGRVHAFAHRPKSVEDDDDAEKAFVAARNWLSAHVLGGATVHKVAV